MNTDLPGQSYGFEEEITPRGNFSLHFRELWQYRELLVIFTMRDIRVKYKQTVLGVLWVVIQPAIMTFIFTYTIGRVIPAGLQSPVPYPVFVYSGLIFWYLFSNGIQSAGNSMLSNENIIKKIYFPRLIIPFSAITVALFDFLVTFILYIIILVSFNTPADPVRCLLYLPLALVINLFAVLGLGTFFAALNIRFRDFRYIIPFMLQFLMFVCPVFYPTSIVSNKWISWIFIVNPVNAVLELSRGVFPGAVVNFSYVLCGFAVAVLFFVTGLLYFRKTESYFADLA